MGFFHARKTTPEREWAGDRSGVEEMEGVAFLAVAAFGSPSGWARTCERRDEDEAPCVCVPRVNWKCVVCASRFSVREFRFMCLVCALASTVVAPDGSKLQPGAESGARTRLRRRRFIPAARERSNQLQPMLWPQFKHL